MGLPNLVIEVALTSGGPQKLARYRRLEIDEVWFWDDDRLSLYIWNEEDYELRLQSELLKGLDLLRVVHAVRTKNLLMAVQIFQES